MSVKSLLFAVIAQMVKNHQKNSDDQLTELKQYWLYRVFGVPKKNKNTPTCEYSTTVSAPAFQAGDVSSILITRSISRVSGFHPEGSCPFYCLDQFIINLNYYNYGTFNSRFFRLHILCSRRFGVTKW